MYSIVTVCHFGQLCPAGELAKHAHLQFHTTDGQHVLAFVDYRRFGRWEEGADWGRDRGPDPVFEHIAFRDNVIANLEAKADATGIFWIFFIMLLFVFFIFRLPLLFRDIFYFYCFC
jgi:hypothetical protein